MIRAFVLALLICGSTQAKGVVSLNLCTDQFLLALAPERIAALSFLARDPTLSVFANSAAAHPWVRADAEAVLKLAPDLVLATNWGAQATLTALERHGTLDPEQPAPEFRRYPGRNPAAGAIARCRDAGGGFTRSDGQNSGQHSAACAD